MATTAMTLLAERWLDEVILFGTIDNTAGAPIAENFTLPAGLGDVAVMSALVRVVASATVPAVGTVARGVELVVVRNNGTTLADVVGSAEWFAVQGSLAAFDEFSCYIDPDALTLVRQDEQFLVRSPEMDVNAAPTADLRLFVKCVRVRPTETIGRALQLVR